MRVKLPLLRTRFVPPARAPILRYGVALLSTILALIPAFLLSDICAFVTGQTFYADGGAP